MIAGFFFDSNEKTVQGMYGHNVEAMILGSEVLQQSGENLVLRGGDLQVRHPGLRVYDVIEEVFGGPRDAHGRLDHWALRRDMAYTCALESVVFAIVIHGISLRTAGLLEDVLLPSMAYLGWKMLDFEHEAHAVLLGEFLQDRYLINGRTVQVPARGDGSDESSLPDHRVETLKGWGFQEVGVGRKRLLDLVEE